MSAQSVQNRMLKCEAQLEKGCSIKPLLLGMQRPCSFVCISRLSPPGLRSYPVQSAWSRGRSRLSCDVGHIWTHRSVASVLVSDLAFQPPKSFSLVTISLTLRPIQSMSESPAESSSQALERFLNAQLASLSLEVPSDDVRFALCID